MYEKYIPNSTSPTNYIKNNVNAPYITNPSRLNSNNYKKSYYIKKTPNILPNIIDIKK